MAADEYLLETALQPTLRLYSWQGPWLSLGYAQRHQWLESLPLREHSIQWVRRPSGGRAVLHDQELTYAIVLPEVEGTIQEVYEQITQLWMTSLQAFTTDLAKSAGSRRGQTNPSCYQLTQRGEVCMQDRKLIGSAQLRRGRRLLQHGSIPLAVDVVRFQAVFGDAELPATLPGLTPQVLLENFPHPLHEVPWSLQERLEIEGLQERFSCL